MAVAWMMIKPSWIKQKKSPAKGLWKTVTLNDVNSQIPLASPHNEDW